MRRVISAHSDKDERHGVANLVLPLANLHHGKLHWARAAAYKVPHLQHRHIACVINIITASLTSLHHTHRQLPHGQPDIDLHITHIVYKAYIVNRLPQVVRVSVKDISVCECERERRRVVSECRSVSVYDTRCLLTRVFV